MKLSEGLQVAASGPRASGTLKIGARRVGWKAKEEVDEVDTARRFSASTRREWTIFEKQPQDSDVDVIGRSENGDVAGGLDCGSYISTLAIGIS